MKLRDAINPATGEVLENFQETSMSEIDEILEAAETTFREWRHRPFAERTQKMRQAAVLLRGLVQLFEERAAL